MPDLVLKPQSPLGGVEPPFPGIDFVEVTDRDIVSIAMPIGSKETAHKAIMDAYQIAPPPVGWWGKSPIDNACFLGTAPEQHFIVFDRSKVPAVERITHKLGDTVYVTDQSDSWVMLRVGGPKCRSALERVCSLDLDPRAFPVGKVARTVMEHLGTIIMSEENDYFLLLSARSSADSFCKAIQRSFENIL